MDLIGRVGAFLGMRSEKPDVPKTREELILAIQARANAVRPEVDLLHPKDMERPILDVRNRIAALYLAQGHPYTYVIEGYYPDLVAPLKAPEHLEQTHKDLDAMMQIYIGDPRKAARTQEQEEVTRLYNAFLDRAKGQPLKDLPELWLQFAIQLQMRSGFGRESNLPKASIVSPS